MPPLIINLGTRSKWSASRPRHKLYRGLGGSQSQSEGCGEEKILLPVPEIEL
jgi:hypothetical protein